MKTASVLIFRPLSQTFTYAIPESLQDDIGVGQHIYVPFGHAKCAGLVLNLDDNSSPNPNLKPVFEINAHMPTLPQPMLDLIMWFADYYHTTPHQAYKCVIGNRKQRPPKKDKIKKPDKEAPLPLTDEQQQAFDTITISPQFTHFLLQGVTGSGKTEIYLQLSQFMLDQNKNVIFLIPEIALTPQFKASFLKRFPGQVSILHSDLTPKQRDLEWQKILDGNSKIALGPRSAIFAPFSDIGLIIIDEEHEGSYKQDNHPRYYTHTVAEHRAKQHNATLILGSATPRIESRQPPYHRLCLTKRIHSNPLPKVDIIDMRKAYENGLRGYLSDALTQRLRHSLDKAEKSIILINRRGYSPMVICSTCQKTVVCKKCQLGITYHKDKHIRCHRCDITYPPLKRCDSCKSRRFTYAGIGTQKIEVELKALFPDAHITRLDKDTAGTAKKMEAILDEFKATGDILIGTQMIAKGHHIDDITTVGVLGIDTALNLPDFRAPERTFQLVTQVAGRSGRGKKTGHVLVQTMQPEHYAIQYAAKQDYDGFYDEEIQYREALWYPSYSRLINIIFSGTNRQDIAKIAAKTSKSLHHHLANSKGQTETIGPKPAPVEKIRNHYRYNTLIKADTIAFNDLQSALKDVPHIDDKNRILLDLDPRSIL